MQDHQTLLTEITMLRQEMAELRKLIRLNLPVLYEISSDAHAQKTLEDRKKKWEKAKIQFMGKVQ